MRTWSNTSKERYDTLDPRLQDVCDWILQNICDISIQKGHRGEAEQNAAYDSGNSKLRWPNGNHNSYPSMAVDVAPYPYPNNVNILYSSLGYIAGAAVAYAKSKGLVLRWGGDWDRDGDQTDNKFDDLFHLEIIDNG